MATIRKRNNTYQIRVSVGADYRGERIIRSMTWTPPANMGEARQEKEVQRIAAEFEIKCRDGEIVDDTTRFCDFAVRWFRDYGESQLRPNTLAQYKALMPRINQAIGHIKLRDLRPHHLVTFYKNLGEDGIRQDGKYEPIIDLAARLKEKGIKKTDLVKKAGVGDNTLSVACKGDHVSGHSAEKISSALGLPLEKVFAPVRKSGKLSNRTIQAHHRVISSILSTAMEWEEIKSNPCHKVRPPKAERTAPRYLDEAGALKLLEALTKEEPKYRMATTLLLLTGMRRGEAMGLEWKDIDFDKAIINIVRTSQYIARSGTITDETKNSSSNRAIKVPASLLVDLRKYRLWQDEERLKVGDLWEDHDRLFTQWNGKPMNPQSYTKWFKGFIERAELGDIVPHSLRHTNATIQIANNVPLTTVAGRLGHATPATTTKIYSHEIKSADAAAAEMLDDIFRPTKAAK